jgi:hypothetical protein
MTGDSSIARARSHSLAFRRTMMIIVLPIAIVVSVVSRMCREMKDAIYLAKLDAQGDIETACEIWRR